MTQKKLVVNQLLKETQTEIKKLEKTLEKKKNKQEEDAIITNLEKLDVYEALYEKLEESYPSLEITVRGLTFKEVVEISDDKMNLRIRGQTTVGDPKIASIKLAAVKKGFVESNSPEITKDNIETKDNYIGEWLYEEINDLSSITPKKNRR